MGMCGKLFMVSEATAEQLVDDATAILAFVAADEATDAELDLDKTWHGLHFLLNGSAWDGLPPLDFLVGGGREVGVDLGSGQARLFDVGQVKAIDSALAGIAVDDLALRLDPAKLEEEDVYPNVWDEPLEDLRAEYADAFSGLQAFVGRAAAAEQGILVAIM